MNVGLSFPWNGRLEGFSFFFVRGCGQNWCTTSRGQHGGWHPTQVSRLVSVRHTQTGTGEFGHNRHQTGPERGEQKKGKKMKCIGRDCHTSVPLIKVTHAQSVRQTPTQPHTKKESDNRIVNAMKRSLDRKGAWNRRFLCLASTTTTTIMLFFFCCCYWFLRWDSSIYHSDWIIGLLWTALLISIQVCPPIFYVGGGGGDKKKTSWITIDTFVCRKILSSHVITAEVRCATYVSWHLIVTHTHTRSTHRNRERWI